MEAILKKTMVCVCVVCAHMHHDTSAENKGQLVEVDSGLPPYGSWDQPEVSGLVASVFYAVSHLMSPW